MAKKPFFSIIVPALNEEKYLPKLLGDLCAQSYQDFEVVVVDGGSKDKTINIAQTFVSQLPKLTILNSPRAHVCTQRNLGANRAASDILIFSDADNRLPSYFLQGIKYRWESSDTDLITVWLKPDKDSRQNNIISSAINIFSETQMSFGPKYLVEAFISIKKSSFEKIGGFNESIDYAEGKSLIRSIVKQKLKYQIFKDPVYTTSFRRFRKEGVIKIASTLAQMELADLIGPEFHSKQAKKLYPMLGGSVFNKSKKAKNKFLKNIQKILRDL